jgi:hypothetical protein
MIEKLSLLFPFLHLFLGAYCQQQPGQIDSMLMPVTGSHHYQPEYLFDKPVDPGDWAKSSPGLHASFGNADTLYFRSEVPAINDEAAGWKATGWKGERLNTQLVVWSGDSIGQVRCVISNLVSESGQQIGKNNIEINLVRYVLSNYPYGSAEAICGESPYKNGFLMPDRFEPFDRFDLPAKTARPIWISCNIPANAAAGKYKGTIEVSSTMGRKKLDIEVVVQPQQLPAPRDWQYRLDLWQNPWVIASYYHVKPWGEEHLSLLKKHLQPYADAGGKYITTYGVHSPWGDNEYAIEEGMIDWRKTRQGKWKFSYEIFDKYIQLAMSIGIDKAITIYTPVPWGNRFRYMDETTGNYVTVTWSPESAEYKAVWNIFLNDLRAHLLKKGWFSKTYLGINENAMEQTLAAIKVINDNSSKQLPGSKPWLITYAGDWHKELNGLLDDYSFLYGKEAGLTETLARQSRGATTSFYVCCNPAKPNNFVFSPPVEGQWISWYAMAHGYSGFLRWAYDAWPADPLRDARFGTWAAGDCYLVYPGGNSSIRFEKLREGIVDYEKISILRRLVKQSSNTKAKEKLLALDQLLSDMVVEKEFKEATLLAAVRKGRLLFNELSVLLSPKK